MAMQDSMNSGSKVDGCDLADGLSYNPRAESVAQPISVHGRAADHFGYEFVCESMKASAWDRRSRPTCHEPCAPGHGGGSQQSPLHIAPRLHLLALLIGMSPRKSWAGVAFDRKPRHHGFWLRGDKAGRARRRAQSREV